ncbi:S-adenosylmethionine-dependent methyltransferase [Massospora cicadina]|nr:S-adenosylmethionine-dependent methyltransferase [Massospora cicadina]
MKHLKWIPTDTSASVRRIVQAKLDLFGKIFACSNKRLPDPPAAILRIKTKIWWRERLANETQVESVIEELIATLPVKWELYGSFALFPPGSFETEVVNDASLDYFAKVVAPALNVDHLARKVSIPATDALRRPKVTPLFGRDWDPVALFSLDSERYTASIFWAQVRQNSVWYIWSPLHTMFSAGNITEKADIISNQSSIHPAVSLLICMAV